MFWKRAPKKRAESTDDADLSRRSMLQTMGVVGASAAALEGCKIRLPDLLHGHDETALALNKPPVPGVERYRTFEERWVNTSCGQCPAGCGVRVRVVEGRAVTITGNPENPVNVGGIGPRGLSGLQVLYDPDRLTGPLVRKDGKLVPISWDDAIALLVDKLRTLRRTGATHRLLVLTGRERGMMHGLFGRFAQVYGTPNFVDGAPSRGAVLAQAMQATMGSLGTPAFEWSGVDQVISFEAGLLEDSCQAVYFARAAGDLHRGTTGHRARLVHTGPGFDMSVHNADEWVRTRPGTSGALALGLCHVLVRDNLFDRRFIETSTTDFEEFRQFIGRFTPAETSAKTGVPPESVVRLARDLGSSTRAFAYADDRTFSFSNGWETALAILSLNALLGAMGRSEAGVRTQRRRPYAEWPAAELDAVARAGLAHPRLDGAATPQYALARSVLATLPGAIEAAGADRPEIALLHAANPAYSRSRPAEWVKALQSIPFVVSFSPFRDETVDEVAHLVLPDHTYLERWDDAEVPSAAGRAVAGIRRPVVEPLHDTRSSGDVLLTVARKLGDSVGAALPWRTFRAALEVRLAGLHAAGRGSIVMANEQDFLKKLYDNGFWAEDEDLTPQPMKFKFHARWEEPSWDGDLHEYPLGMLVYRPLGYAEGSGANLPWLRFLRPRPRTRCWTAPIALHPDSLPGAEDGDEVVVESHGTFTAPVRIDRTMHLGYVAVPAGGGHTAFGRWAKGFGNNPMHVLSSRPAPTTGATVMCNTRARVRLLHPHKPRKQHGDHGDHGDPQEHG